jgi:hypothetical protein
MIKQNFYKLLFFGVCFILPFISKAQAGNSVQPVNNSSVPLPAGNKPAPLSTHTTKAVAVTDTVLKSQISQAKLATGAGKVQTHPAILAPGAAVQSKDMLNRSQPAETPKQ